MWVEEELKSAVELSELQAGGVIFIRRRHPASNLNLGLSVRRLCCGFLSRRSTKWKLTSLPPLGRDPPRREQRQWLMLCAANPALSAPDPAEGCRHAGKKQNKTQFDFIYTVSGPGTVPNRNSNTMSAHVTLREETSADKFPLIWVERGAEAFGCSSLTGKLRLDLFFSFLVFFIDLNMASAMTVKREGHWS